eukprot:2430812-Pyramimonas_sp.AAC.1
MLAPLAVETRRAAPLRRLAREKRHQWGVRRAHGWPGLVQVDRGEPLEGSAGAMHLPALVQRGHSREQVQLL